METLIATGTELGRYFIAIPMAFFGVQHFFYAPFVAAFIPAYIPGRLFWSYFCGVALIAAGMAIVSRIWARLAATLLGTMIFLWVLLLHVPRVAANPRDRVEWLGIFQALAMSGFVFVLAGTLARKKGQMLPDRS